MKKAPKTPLMPPLAPIRGAEESGSIINQKAGERIILTIIASAKFSEEITPFDRHFVK